MVTNAVRDVLKSVGLYETARETWLSIRRPAWWVAKRQRIAFFNSLAPVGSLVFDIGANVGEYAREFLEMGRRVVSVEPNPECAAALRKQFASNEQFKLVEAAMGPSEGQIRLHLADATAISSCSPEWIERVSDSGRFTGHGWQKAIDVRMTTLDSLIATHGTPAHTKIDVEGFELEVLHGLSQRAGLISLEFTPETIERTIACVAHLRKLGYREFNYSYHSLNKLALDNWIGDEEFVKAIQKLHGDGQTLGGDIFAR